MSARHQQQPRGVHLVGSVPLPSNEHTFSQICRALPKRIRRITDGETGVRANFAAFQIEIFPPEVLGGWVKENAEIRDDEVARTLQRLPLTLETHYDDHAISSYAVFCRLRTEGVIPPNVRFQVCLPSPLIVIACCIHARYQAAVEVIYEAAILHALQRIQKEIPAHDLAIQWDMPGEIAFLEGVPFTPWFTPVKAGVSERISRLTTAVSDDVELGFHLCYGDSGHRHFVEPKDTAVLVELANIILEQAKRRIDWIHLPVPKDRHDATYFAPLRGLKDLGSAELYLGVVHSGDEEGTMRRIQGASDVLEKFGVATECGMGRTPIAELASILEISAAVSHPVI